MTEDPAIVDVVRRIDDANERLAAPAQRIEQVFIDTGAELAACSRLLQQVIAQFESLPNEFNGESLGQATAQLTHVGKRSQQIAGEMQGAGAELVRLSAVLSGAALPVDRLRRTVRMMGIVATNARIGAASLAQKEDGFDSFADDVTALSSSMLSTVSEFFETYNELSGAVSAAAKAQARFVESQREPLAAAAAALSTTLDQVTAQRNSAIAQSDETSRKTRDIVMKVGETVMAMQSGDAVRQRLEHVQAAFGLVDKDAHGGSQIARLIELQRRQLAGARAMLVEEVDIATLNLTQLVSDVDALLGLSQSLNGGGGGSSALAKLQLVVQDSVKVLQQCEAERHSLDATAAEVSGKVKSMLRVVESVEHLEQQMRVVSLNAAVRCSRLEQRGRALNVIAQQLRDLTRETLAVAGEAVSILRKAVEISGDFATSIKANNAASIGDLEEQASAALGQLASFDKRLEDVLRGLAQDVPQVQQKLKSVGKLIDAGRSIASEIEGAETSFASVAEVPNDQPDDGDFYEVLRQTYTMDAERHIHDEFVGAA